jgi:phosphohistidine phosphatase
MKLYLVRHASAVEYLGGGIKKDEERPLVPEGKAEAETMAKTLKHLGVQSDAFVCSPLVRARQTAEIFAEVLGGKDKLHISKHLAPAGEPSELFKELAEYKRAENVFLFGHMPDISHLAQQLLGVDEMDMPFKKSAVCRIDVYSMPPNTPGTLKWFLTPRIAEACQKQHSQR